MCLNVFLTGASGFVGAAIVDALCTQDNINLMVTSRRPLNVDRKVQKVFLEISECADGASYLANQDVVIHAAAKIPNSTRSHAEDLTEFREINTHGTLNLAKRAAKAGVKRFIFISSIKVNGEGTNSYPYTHKDSPSPDDAYGWSKLEAEQGLSKIAQDTGMEVVIIRPPLVYGPKVKGNFGLLVSLVNKRWPLPLGSVVSNKRSFVSIDNLVDLILTCIDHPAAVGEIFLVSDDRDVSTAELLQTMAEAYGNTVPLIRVPPLILKVLASLLGQSKAINRLVGSLQLDIAHTKETLDWMPPVSLEEGLRRCVEIKKGAES